LKPASPVEVPDGSHQSGEDFLYRSFIFFLAKENRTKRKRPRPASPCASPKRPEHAETRPPQGVLRQPACFFPAASSMIGAGQRKLNHPLTHGNVNFDVQE
jgi:hypothetical protein